MVIIVNELAPRAHDAPWKKLLEKTLGRGVEVTEVRVRSFERARAAADGAAAWGADIVVPVGGDGTVNACVNGIGARPTRIAVIPAGTANDLARQLGEQLDPVRAAVTMSGWRRADIDALRVNGTDYYSVGGAGFFAEVAATANRWRASSALARQVLGRLGSLIYNLACLITIVFSRKLGDRYRIDYTDAFTGRDETIEVDAYGMLVANFARVGKSFALAPDSQPSDGVFEMIIMPRTGRHRLLALVALATRGRTWEIDELMLVRARRAVVEGTQAIRFFGDGETLCQGSKAVKIEVAEAPLRLMAPVEEVEATAGDSVPALALST